MYNLSSLLKSLPKINRSRMVVSGWALWVVWPETLNQAVGHTLKDYGGLCMAEENNQSIWWFPSAEVLRAVARLQVWSRMGKSALFFEIIPVTFMVGYGLEVSMSVPAELVNQKVPVPDSFEVWVHSKLENDVRAIPGLSLKEGNPDPGMSSTNWKLLEADQSLDYETARGWYFIIKPLGRMQEKDSVLNWRAFFKEIQDLLQRLRIKYIADETEWFVIFPVESMRMLRTVCKELLDLTSTIKADPEKTYWPSVMAAIQQKGLPFTNELPRKFNLDWTKLAPDFPHLQYRDALLMTEWFNVNELRFSSDHDTMDSWCNISLKAGSQEEVGSMEVALPRKLLMGEGDGCFYCGLRSHAAAQCPSRSLRGFKESPWGQLAALDLDEINKGVEKLDEIMDGEGGRSVEDLLMVGKGVPETIVRAIFAINSPAQYRTLQLVWRSRGKDWPTGLRQLAPSEGKLIWKALKIVLDGELEEAEVTLKQAGLKYSRSYQPPSLRGFVAVEMEDFHQGHFYWQESERLSYTPLQRGYFQYLQARAKEVEGEVNEAAGLYREAHETSPQWLDPLYRHAVCLVKMGFIGQALDVFYELVDKDANMFNRLLVDPELDRGRIHLMSALWEKWKKAENDFKEDKERLDKLTSDLGNWFETDHEFYDKGHQRIEELQQMANKRNFVSFKMLAKGLQDLTDDLSKEVDLEIDRMRERIKEYQSRLTEVQKEASWFPFPRLLREFNREFNSCVERINWINSQHLKSAEVFRRAQRYMLEIDENLSSLIGRLVTLRIIRDGTLFTLILGRNFIWFELIGLGLALLAIPAFLWFTKGMEGNWLVDIVTKQKWEVQKALVLILSILALALASIKSALSFEKRKRELFETHEE